MNKARRGKIRESLIFMERARDRLSVVLDGEQSAMDNIPDNLQESDRYQTMEDTIDFISDTIDDIDDLINGLSQII